MTQTTPVLTTRQFWGIFSSAWLAYAVLLSGAYLLQGERLGEVLMATAVNVTPLVLPATFLAARRRRFLEPHATLGRDIAHKIAGGLGYALSVASIGGILVWLLPQRPTSELGGRPIAIFAVLMMLGLFMYAIVLGFLVWADSLERVHESRALAAREAVLRAQAEAKALRAQFNPHFVFNTLHSLMLLVRKEPERAERAIEDVAALIRYASTLQRQEIDQVSLGKEVAFAERYLALEKLRLADRLEVVREIDDGLDDVLVPAFSLQTLLENSIRHGISPKPEGGRVRIRATARDGALDMVVEDDGLGADPARVGDTGGSGLHLLRQRLAVVYGGAATLDWRTARGEGFTAALRLPLRRAPEPADR